MKNFLILLIASTFGVHLGTTFAGPLTIPNTFTAGSPAVAADVNTNFSAVETAVDDNDARINTKQDRVTQTCAAGSSIRAISSTGTVTCETDNDSGGDITAVNPGSGLTGGGATGSVTLSIPTSGITSTHIGPNAVGGSEIINNSIFDFEIVDEAGLDYSGTGYYDIINLTNCNATTTITSVSVTAPTSGYVYVSASGRFCTYPSGVWSWIMLDDAPGGASFGYDGNNYRYDYSATQRACGIGQYTEFSFQNVYPVSAGTRTFYLKGCTSTSAGDGNLYYHPLVGIFFPTRY